MYVHIKFFKKKILTGCERDVESKNRNIFNFSNKMILYKYPKSMAIRVGTYNQQLSGPQISDNAIHTNFDVTILIFIKDSKTFGSFRFFIRD